MRQNCTTSTHPQSPQNPKQQQTKKRMKSIEDNIFYKIKTKKMIDTNSLVTPTINQPNHPSDHNTRKGKPTITSVAQPVNYPKHQGHSRLRTFAGYKSTAPHYSNPLSSLTSHHC